jgi:hypothetical protein
LIEYPPEHRDLYGQVGILDNGPPPDGRYDLLFRDEISGPLHEHAENIKRPRADRYRNKNAAFIAPGQAISSPVEAKVLEQENIGGGEHA